MRIFAFCLLCLMCGYGLAAGVTLVLESSIVSGAGAIVASLFALWITWRAFI